MTAQGTIFGTRFCFTEQWAQGGACEVEARLSLDSNFFSGKFTDLKSGASGVIEGERTSVGMKGGLNTKSTIFRVSLLLSHVCGRVCAVLYHGLDYEEGPTTSLDASCLKLTVGVPPPVDAVPSFIPLVDDCNKWFTSALFSGGLPLLGNGRLEFGAFLSKYFDSKGSGSYSAWKGKLFTINESMEEPRSSMNTGSLPILRSLEHGLEDGVLLDDLISPHIGLSSIFKLGGTLFLEARKLILCVLIKHCGCDALCEDMIRMSVTSASPLSSLKSPASSLSSDRPCDILLDIWRAAQRVIESVLRRKQTNDIPYAVSIAEIRSKAELLLELFPQASALGFADNLHVSSYREKEALYASDLSRTISEVVEFLSSSSCSVDMLRSRLVQGSMKTVLRIAALRSFLFLFEKSHQVVDMFRFGPMSSVALQAGAIGFIASAILGQRGGVIFAQSAGRDAAGMTAGHYADGLEGGTSALLNELREAFERVYEFISQLLSRATWAGDRDAQCLALAAWSIRICPEDHSFLNRVGIFRILQTVLDDTRTTLQQITTSINTSPESEVDKLSQSSTRRLSQLSLRIVHSLASQVARCGNYESTATVATGKLRKVVSGPDTLSLSLFDMLYSELFSGMKFIIAHAVTPPEVLDTSLQLTSAELEGRERYMYSVLRLLYSVSSSTVCLKSMSSVKWLTLLLGCIGCGDLSLQRKLLQLLRRIIPHSDPTSMRALITGLYSSREEIVFSETVLDDEDFEMFLSTSSFSSAAVYDRFVSLMLEAVCVTSPVVDANGNTKSKKLVQHMRDNNTIDCISSEAVSILRSLLSEPRWKGMVMKSLRRQVNSVSFREDDPYDVHAAIAMMGACGGYIERVRIGGKVLLNSSSSLSRENDVFASRLAAASHRAAMLLSRTGSLAEVVLMSETSKKSSLPPVDLPEKVAVGTAAHNAHAIRPLKVNLTDVSAPSESLDVPCDVPPDMFSNILDFLSLFCIPFINKRPARDIDATEAVNEDITCRQLYLALSTLKAASVCAYSATHGDFLMRHSVFDALLDLALKETSLGGLSILEAIEEKWNALLDAYCFDAELKADELPPVDSMKRVIEKQELSEEDILARADSRALGNRLGLSGFLSPSGLFAALGMGSGGTNREADPNLIEQMMVVLTL